MFFQCDHPGCMGVLRAAAQKQEQQRMATLEILQVSTTIYIPNMSSETENYL